MHNPNSRGVFYPHVANFISMKHSLGYQATSMEISLKAFDRFSRSKGVDRISISEPVAKEWCAKRKGESNDTWSHRVNFLRQFCVYLYNMGFDVYIPRRQPVKKDDNFIPYIYSDEEMRAIFNAADSLRLYDRHMNGVLFIIPCLLRLLFATGLRIGEALVLKMEDVNIESGFLIVRKSKNGKERVVPFTNSLSRVLAQYVSYRDRLPCLKSEYFFIRPNGENCRSYSAVYYWWKKILYMAKVPSRGKVVGPRIHDARHCFCVGSMKKMIGEGKDLYYALPVLSTYIGHGSLASTDKYVRMTAEMHPALLDKTESICTYIFPEIKSR